MNYRFPADRCLLPEDHDATLAHIGNNGADTEHDQLVMHLAAELTKACWAWHKPVVGKQRREKSKPWAVPAYVMAGASAGRKHLREVVG